MTRSATDATHEGTRAGDVRDLVAFIRPKPDELRWREVDWQTSLQDACRIASATDRPVFLWAMNGNALGCT